MMDVSDRHRIRSLIPYLDYSTLRKAKILPKKAMFTKIPKGGKLPTLASKMRYDKFGIFTETIIQSCLSGDLTNIKVKDHLQKYFKIEDYIEVKNLVCDHFSAPKEVLWDTEWPVEDIVGHPDIVYQDCVYDIKTTGRFNAMRSETILQVLSYFCLAQKLGKCITRVGLVLPAQRLILTYDLSTWKWERFWEALKGCIPLKLQRESLYKANPLDLLKYQLMAQQARVGMHVGKDGLLDLVPAGSALQFFVGGRSSSVINLSGTFKKKLKNEIEKHRTKVFIHAPYVINLSNPHGKEPTKDGEIPWGCTLLQKLLKIGEECSLSGIVVHCGKRGKLSELEAVQVMKTSLEDTLKDLVVQKCPLLLETSSGQGGETLCSPEELASFWSSFSKDIRNKIKICVDTCHVFASGHSPMQYLLRLGDFKVPVALIHYNDSKCPKGSKKDRHAPIGRGYIGFEEMYSVLEWALFNKVPCVVE